MNIACVAKGGRILVAYLFVALSWNPTASNAAPAPRFHVADLGDVDPRAMNNHGDVVGRTRTGRAFVNRDGVMQELLIGDAPHFSGGAVDINDSGQIVALVVAAGRDNGFLIGPDGVLDLNEQTGLRVYPAAINEAGVIAATVSREFSSEAITWSNGVVRYLGYIDPAGGSYARGINNRGVVLGNVYTNAIPTEPSLFTAIFQNGEISLILPYAEGEALNDFGQIACTSYHTGATLYSGGHFTDIGVLPGDRGSWPHGINNHADVVGYSEGPGEVYRAFLYTDGTLYDLNDLIGRNSGWVLWVANDINEKGQIIGQGTYFGQERAFLLTPRGSFGKSRPKLVQQR